MDIDGHSKDLPQLKSVRTLERPVRLHFALQYLLRALHHNKYCPLNLIFTIHHMTDLNLVLRMLVKIEMLRSESVIIFYYPLTTNTTDCSFWTSYNPKYTQQDFVFFSSFYSELCTAHSFFLIAGFDAD